ncbi:MAG TPA: hypothetical protein PLK76_02935 [bacterium]|nr:hypothetical protein [bacterium]
MDKNNKTKIYILLGLCLLIILGFWLYSLKLNLSSLNNNATNKGIGAKSLINTIVDIFKAHPLTEPEEKVTTPVEELTNKIAEEIKNQNNSTSTADWLTYRNEELGFEFKYPKEWFWNNIDKTLTNYSREEGDLNGGIFTSPSIKIVIDVFPLDDLDEKSVLNCGKSDDEKTIMECEDIYINNLKFKKTISHIEVLTKGYSITVVTIHNNSAYYLTGVFNDYDQITEIKSIFNTFKFLK